MDLNELNDYYLKNLPDMLSKENEFNFLLSDFKTDLFKYDQHLPTQEFLDSVSSHMIVSDIVQPTRIENNSKTPINNIYSNVITPKNISGNLTTTISDHLPQFFIAPGIFSNAPSTKLNIFERDWSKFDQQNSITDKLSVDWENLAKSDMLSVLWELSD